MYEIQIKVTFLIKKKNFKHQFLKVYATLYKLVFKQVFIKFY